MNQPAGTRLAVAGDSTKPCISHLSPPPPPHIDLTRSSERQGRTARSRGPKLAARQALFGPSRHRRAVLEASTRDVVLGSTEQGVWPGEGAGWLRGYPARLPPRQTGFNPPAGSLLDFHIWELCWTMPLIGRFSRGSPNSPTLSFQHSSILTSRTLVGSQDFYVNRQTQISSLFCPPPPLLHHSHMFASRNEQHTKETWHGALINRHAVATLEVEACFIHRATDMAARKKLVSRDAEREHHLAANVVIAARSS
ncbi:hypothetical protein PR048_019537 [Dryococelus australis]|uniref:Uncharacterized protein n=1 Tax=Dryococelus australis TaxID=614101 RepID=A0ABQ9H3V1_9NEOP|nr:hypothetical protein PR048_019537 [Dryococelus australis]